MVTGHQRLPAPEDRIALVDERGHRFPVVLAAGGPEQALSLPFDGGGDIRLRTAVPLHMKLTPERQQKV